MSLRGTRGAFRTGQHVCEEPGGTLPSRTPSPPPASEVMGECGRAPAGRLGTAGAGERRGLREAPGAGPDGGVSWGPAPGPGDRRGAATRRRRPDTGCARCRPALGGGRVVLYVKDGFGLGILIKASCSFIVHLILLLFYHLSSKKVI